MKRFIFTIVSMVFITSCSSDTNNKFVGTWQARMNDHDFLVRFNDDDTYSFDWSDEGVKEFSGVYYVLPEQNVISFDNRATKVNEDAVGKYIFENEKLEILFIGLNNTSHLTLMKIKP